MGREYEEEKLFSEKIDLLLAGKEVENGPAVAEDERTAVEFARRLTDLRVSPSPAFKSYLKTKLLETLHEQETAKRNWFWKLVPREPLWQVVAVIAFMCVTGGILWGTIFQGTPGVEPTGPISGITSAPATTSAATTSAPTTSAAMTTTVAATTTSVVTATTTQPAATTTSVPVTSPAPTYLAAAGSTDKSLYQTGDNVSIRMVWKNVSSQTLTIREYPPLLSIMQKSTGKPVYTFAAGDSSMTLVPGGQVEYTQVWDQTDFQGRHVEPDSYYLELEELYYEGNAVPMKLTQPVDFTILSPSSGIQGDSRILNVGQTLSVNGLSFTLQQVEITSGSIIVRAVSSTPPDYTLIAGTPAPTPTQIYSAAADYSVNGSWFTTAGSSFVEYYADKMDHTWIFPASLPSGAETLTFRINTLGPWPGPWRFDIKL